MTLEELLAREAIRDTMARYHMAGDGNDADGYAGVFAEDGVLDSADFRIEGRAAIRAWKAGRASGPQPAKFVRHNLTTCQIDLTGPETAKARAYFAVFTEVGPDHSGYYSDEFRKVGEAWLIAYRKVWIDWRAPESRFRGPLPKK
jgi:3-phenylpropionate/cinnamic acid dioxygenase small subunit